jgi:pimeloyl-ACP methyl ester carboxylesterase
MKTSRLHFIIWFCWNLLLTVLYALAAPVIHRLRGSSFDSDGVRIHYTDEGEGEPVVLIHGFAVTGDIQWRYPGVTRMLKKHFRVITIDNRGHGRSDKPGDAAAYGMETVRDITRLLDHLGIQKAHVAGYSMGGFMTLKLVTESPDRVLSAAVCAAGWDRLTDKNRVLIEEISASLLAGSGFTPLLIRLHPGPKPPGRLQLAVQNAVMSLIVNPRIMGCVMERFTELVVEEEKLKANTVPVLSVAGGRDPLSEMEAKLHGRLASHRSVVLPGFDHVTTVTNPVFAPALRDFFLEQRNA